ncbi:MAG: DNA mismatch repair protein MutS [Desulfobacterales bacterium]|nr:DNA mismatch repair protein MutS [Desulfobacterales bacterium]
MAKTKITPMIQQYLSIKDKYPDALLFYRMGDFYEMFFQDAETASRALEITLTSRNKHDDVPVPMCGVPYRAAQGYIARLIEQGYKVAICDQVENPAEAKGLVKREVVRVVTPGMIVEDDLLDGKSNNYLLALARDGDRVGIASLDISTADFRMTESADLRAVAEEVRRISPREILLAVSSDAALQTLAEAVPERAVTSLADDLFDHRSGRNRLLEQFNTLSLEGFGCETMRTGVRAAGALLAYVHETQKQTLSHLTRIRSYGLEDHLVIDSLSCQNLELFANIRTGSRQGTLLSVMDHTRTAMGGRMLKMWMRYPLVDAERIIGRHDAVEELLAERSIADTVRDRLKKVYDLERLGSKIAMGHANARDLTALKQSLLVLPGVVDDLGCCHSPLLKWPIPLAGLTALAERIHRAIREDAPLTIQEGGIICTGYSDELDELIQISRDGKGWLARLEADEKAATGINALKVRYNKVFGYYIEIPKAHAAGVPVHYVRKQTLVNAERYITDDLKQFEQKVLTAEDQRASMEYDLFNDIRARVMEQTRDIQQVAEFLAGLDCLLALAEAADKNDYHRPEINDNGILAIEDGRHPVIEKMIAGERFVPNSLRLDDASDQVLIITGPNMAGKSTVLRQVALTVLMAQMGAFVPAKKVNIPLTDRIFTRVGALDNLSQGQSTFMVEMQETANILNSATDRSLVIMDEIGRGTSTFDGLSIAWAVAEYLHDLNGCGVKTLFATHYHELTELAQNRERVKNYNIAVKEWNEEIIFLRKLVEGGTNRSYGIQVARLAGIPMDVIRRAKAILFDIENRNGVPPAPQPDSGASKTLKKQGVQLELFHQPEAYFIRRLKQMDISRMTPLEALNCLNGLKDEAETVG